MKEYPKNYTPGQLLDNIREGEMWEIQYEITSARLADDYITKSNGMIYLCNKDGVINKTVGVLVLNRLLLDNSLTFSVLPISYDRINKKEKMESERYYRGEKGPIIPKYEGKVAEDFAFQDMGVRRVGVMLMVLEDTNYPGHEGKRTFNGYYILETATPNDRGETLHQVHESNMDPIEDN